MIDITFAMQAPRVARIIERITGIKDQIPDPSLYAAGPSAMGFGMGRQQIAPVRVRVLAPGGVGRKDAYEGRNA